MTMHVKGIGLKFPDGTGQTTAAVGRPGDATGGSGVYTKEETDAKLATKANVGVSYTKAEAEDLVNAKADIGVSYTKAETETRLTTKADVEDVYTKTQVDSSQSAQDTKINANTAKVSNATHTGDVTGSTTLTIGTGKVTEAKLASNSVTAAKIAANAVGASEIAADAVGSSEIAANAVKASELSVSGNGNTSQYLRADGDGTFTWAVPPGTTQSTSYGAKGTYSIIKNSTMLSNNSTVNNPQAMPSGSFSGTWRIMGLTGADGGTIGSTYYYLAVRIS